MLRRLDRWVGIPIVLAMVLRPKRRGAPRPSEMRRVGLLKTAAIGDTLLLAGMVEDVQRSFPLATVVIITGTDNRDAARLLPRVEGRDVEYLGIDVRRPIAAVRAIRAERLDMLVDFGAWPRLDALITGLSGARWRAGFRTQGQARHWGYDVVQVHSRALHERDNYKELLRAVGVVGSTPARLAHVEAARAELCPRGEFALFCPWSGGYLARRKEWPLERWVALGERLRDRGLSLLVSGAPADAERSARLATALAEAGCGATSIAGRASLGQLAGVALRASIVVSVNTGVMHLAALAGAPTLSLEGPVPTARWGPIGPCVASVVAQGPECGYVHLGGERPAGAPDCMARITVDEVALAIDALLARCGAAARPAESP